MSSLLCGTFTLAREHSLREAGDLCFTLAAAALDQRLGLQLGSAIVQPSVFDVLGCGRAFDGRTLPFLVTDNPMWDASDGVADKYAPEYPDEEPDGPLPVRLARVQRFFSRVIAEPGVASVLLVVTRGPGAAHAEDACRSDELVERLLPRYADVLEIPFVRLHLKKPTAD